MRLPQRIEKVNVQVDKLQNRKTKLTEKSEKIQKKILSKESQLQKKFRKPENKQKIVDTISALNSKLQKLTVKNVAIDRAVAKKSQSVQKLQEKFNTLRTRFEIEEPVLPTPVVCTFSVNGVSMGAITGEDGVISHSQIKMFVSDLYRNNSFSLPIKIAVRTKNGGRYFYTLNTLSKFQEFLEINTNNTSDAEDYVVESYDIYTVQQTEEEKEISQLNAII